MLCDGYVMKSLGRKRAYCTWAIGIHAGYGRPRLSHRPRSSASSGSYWHAGCRRSADLDEAVISFST